MNNPNNIKVGDVIEVEQAWEDTMGSYHDEFPIVLAIAEDGRLTLDFGRKDLNEFLATAGFYASDYKTEPLFTAVKDKDDTWEPNDTIHAR